MYRFSANSRATISSTAIFLSQQSRQYFSSPFGSEMSLAPQSAHRDLAIDLRGMRQFTIYNSVRKMDRPKHAGLRHLALNTRNLEAMQRFYVDFLGFAIEWQPDPDNVYLTSGADNLALHRVASPRSLGPIATARGRATSRIRTEIPSRSSIIRRSAGADCGRVHALAVLFDHPACAETGRDRPDGFLHDGHPAARDAAGVPVVVRGHDVFLEQAVERVRVGAVSRVGVVRRRAAVDHPAVVAREPFGPPAVADAQVGHAIHRGFHAARAAGLVRLAWRVEPEVAALYEEMRDVHIVVVDKGHATGEQRIKGASIDPLEVVLADVVGRMCFAGKHDLHGSADAVQNPGEPLGVGEDQIGSLVSGKAAGESDGERGRVEQRPGRDHTWDAHTLLGPALTRAFTHKAEQVRSQGLSDGPEILVGNGEDGVPQCRLVLARGPADAEMLVEKIDELGRHPGGKVHAVRDVRNRQLGQRDPWPDARPHLARDLAVQLADRVDAGRGSHRQRRHVELHAAAAVVCPERQKPIAMRAERPPDAGQMFFHHVEWKCIVSRSHGRMRREDRRFPDGLEGGVETVATLDEIMDALQDDKCGVAFVEVKRADVDAEGLERAHAVDAEHDLLLDARLPVATVQARRQLSVPWCVLLEVGVEQVERHAPHPDAPYGDEHRALAEWHGSNALLAVGQHGELDGRVGPIQTLVAFLLPAFGRQVLVEVALRVHEADADERHAQISSFLAVIAGEHAQAARIDWHRLVKGELGREVRHRAAAQLRERPRPPGVSRRSCGVERLDRVIVESEKLRIGGGGFQLLLRDRPQHAYRVVGRAPPQFIVQPPEHRAGLIPAPPQVDGQFVEACDSWWTRGQGCVSAHEWSGEIDGNPGGPYTAGG